MTRPLLIFAKAPVAGTVKTRLMPALGPDGARDLYIELFELTLRQTAGWPGERYLYCAPDDLHPFFIDAAQRHRLHRRTQRDGDLGARMLGAMEGHPAGALLIGTDCPDLGLDHLQQAAEALADHDVAVLPSEDGGYVLIGQSRPHSAPFSAMTWSHAEVMNDTRQRIGDAGLSLWVGPTLWDIDEPEDLERYRALRCDQP
ncbi:hypothetical protein SAMN05216421_0682 [Halopseudomonas xinjiangensis]|uniref:Glycosyltransferase n=1 Tax=Halopseudomonas xinjiangensis TaxID=487184 RepID=A0A1H1NGP5_9GAMM|nr:TIGR04282 family arsenosugar biosynthesis glycosyltransferase [Halopseudomonas xinjiangensis]SDR98127.1 hypothetical protein SAMN05216421_0682 [Halopseudomonas xinjiangensis]